MTISIYDTDDTLAEMVHDVTLGELLQLKRENPDAADWYDDLILAKKDQMGIADLGTTWGVQITANTDKEVADLDPNNWSQMEKEKSDRVPINRSKPENDKFDRVPINGYYSDKEITVNGNTPCSLGSQDEAFPKNRTAYAFALGETTVASRQSVQPDQSQESSEIERRGVPINENTVADGDFFQYIKIDWFDNGQASERADGKRVNARHKFNIQFRFDEDSELNSCRGKVCSENRYWKRNIDIDDPFYADVWYWYETFSLQHSPSDGCYYDFNPRLGHIYLKSGDRIKDAALMFLKFEGKLALVKLWIAGVEMVFELFDEQPSGQEKCPALKARYIHKGVTKKEKKSPVSFDAAFGR